MRLDPGAPTTLVPAEDWEETISNGEEEDFTDMAKIAELTKKYDGEWLAIAVGDQRDGTYEEGELVFHSQDEVEVWKRIAGDERKIYVTYSGPLIEPGYAVAF